MYEIPSRASSKRSLGAAKSQHTGQCASEIVDHIPFAEALFPWQNKEHSSLI